MTYFSREKVEELYGGVDGYLERFAEYTDRQAAEGWLTKTDAEKMKEWSRKAARKYL